VTQDRVKKAYVPQFPNLAIENFLEHFNGVVPIYDYLPDQGPLSKVPRSFILDVFLFLLQITNRY